MAKIKPKLSKSKSSQWEIIDDVSTMGYRDDSPYRNKESIDIHSPNGLIDMSETGMPILANGRYLPPYSGMHQFEPGVVREERIMQDGGNVNPIEGDLYSKILMNRNKDKDFVQRANAVGQYPNSPMFNQWDDFDTKATHKMGWGEDDSGQAFMFPTIMNKNNEAIKVPNQYANYISEQGYKNATGMPIMQDGGNFKFQNGEQKKPTYSWSTQETSKPSITTPSTSQTRIAAGTTKPLTQQGILLAQEERAKQQATAMQAERENRISVANKAQNEQGFPTTPKQWAEQTQAIGDKMRVVSKAPNVIDDYLNPLVWVGNMATNVGQVPLDVQQGNYLKATKSLATPLAVGAIGSIGANTQKQFLNNTFNPLASSHITHTPALVTSKIAAKKTLQKQGASTLGEINQNGGLISDLGYQNNSQYKENPYAFGGNVMLERYKEGGSKRKKKKQTTTTEISKVDMYGKPIESKFTVDPNVERSYYDPKMDAIYMQKDYNELDPYQKERMLAHENYHAYQFKNDRSTYLPIKDVPYQRPSMVSTDDIYYGYHNRKPIEAQIDIDRFKEKNPSFQFISDDAIFNKVVDSEQYLNPQTFEGEAKFYEDLGAESNEPLYAKGGLIKRADGSYSRRGLWDNIRENAGSGKKPTKEMLKQEKKIKAAEKKANGGAVWEILEEAKDGKKISLEDFKPRNPNSNERIQQEIVNKDKLNRVTKGSKENPVNLEEITVSAPRNRNPVTAQAAATRWKEENPELQGSSADVALALFAAPLIEATHTPSRVANYLTGAYKNQDLGFNPYNSELSQTLGLETNPDDAWHSVRNFLVDNAADFAAPSIIKGFGKGLNKSINYVDDINLINKELKFIREEGLSKGLSEKQIKSLQMEKVGITDNQRKAFTPVLSDVLSKYVKPISYEEGVISKLKDIPKNIKQGGWKNDPYFKDYTHTGKREDAWNLYLGKPQINNTFRYSETVPKSMYYPELKNNLDIYNLNYEDDLADFVKYMDKSKTSKYSDLVSGNTIYPSDAGVMGGYNLTRIDGNYPNIGKGVVEYNDIWDLHPKTTMRSLFPKPIANNTWLNDNVFYKKNPNGSLTPREIELKMENFIGKPFMSHGRVPVEFESLPNTFKTISDKEQKLIDFMKMAKGYKFKFGGKINTDWEIIE